MSPGPLKGIRITEFTSAWAGPYATCMLAFLGAEVIKVESMRRLDHSRVLSFSTGKKYSTPNESSVFNTLNLNKLSVTLNISKPGAVAIAKRLVAVSDAVAENMRPGVMQRLGLGYEAFRAVRPDLIYLSSSACGQVGPEREYIGYAPTFAALGGISHVTGFDDWPPSNFMGAMDLRSATTSAFALLMALCFRQRTGEGQYIDLASQETVAALTGESFLDYFMNRRVPDRKGNRDDSMAPHNCYPCRGDDRWLSIAVATEEEWKALCRVMGNQELASDQRFSNARRRWENQAELDSIIRAWTREQDDYELMSKLQSAGVAAAPSLSSEGLFKDPHLKERGIYTQVDHPVIGKDWVVRPPWKLSAFPGAIDKRSPLIGEHNDYVFKTLLGMSDEEIRKLQEEEAIY